MPGQLHSVVDGQLSRSKDFINIPQFLSSFARRHTDRQTNRGEYTTSLVACGRSQWSSRWINIGTALLTICSSAGWANSMQCQAVCRRVNQDDANHNQHTRIILHGNLDIPPECPDIFLINAPKTFPRTLVRKILRGQIGLPWKKSAECYGCLLLTVARLQKVLCLDKCGAKTRTVCQEQYFVSLFFTTFRNGL